MAGCAEPRGCGIPEVTGGNLDGGAVLHPDDVSEQNGLGRALLTRVGRATSRARFTATDSWAW